MIEFVKADMDGLEEAFSFIEDAKKYLKSNGINQWQSGYPDKKVIELDIEKGRGYFIVMDKKRIGYICLDSNEDPEYRELEGKWITDNKYIVIHRITIYGENRKSGISYKVFEKVEELAKEQGIHSIRIDTKEYNTIMQHILGKCGYEYCGTLIAEDGKKRKAYEKVIF